MELFDPADFRRFILLYPQQFSIGLTFAKKLSLPQKAYSNIVICAMGGSALAGEILESYLLQETACRIPVLISRSYHIPPGLVSKQSLVLFLSYSGSTEETLSCYDEARKTGATLITISNGGALKDRSLADHGYHIPYQIPIERFEGRFAITYAFATLLAILTNAGILDTIGKFPTLSTRDLEVKGESIAKKIAGSTPVIYAPDSLSHIAKSWKIKLNENAKTPAFWNVFPELNHNEMIGFTNPQGAFSALILTDKEVSPDIRKRIDITSALMQEKGLFSEIIELKGTGFLEKLLYGLVLGDWVAYSLAYEYGQDPTPMEMVSELKRRLK